MQTISWANGVGMFASVGIHTKSVFLLSKSALEGLATLPNDQHHLGLLILIGIVDPDAGASRTRLVLANSSTAQGNVPGL